MADYLEPTELEKAYAAGLFDGEGCVQLYLRPSTYSGPDRKDNAFRSNLSLSSVDPAVIDWIIKRWGGALRKVDGQWRRERGYRPAFYVQMTALVAERFARHILPYAIIKREQLELWLEARSITYAQGSRGRPNGGLPAEEVQIRQRLVDQIAALKRKEYSHR